MAVPAIPSRIRRSGIGNAEWGSGIGELGGGGSGAIRDDAHPVRAEAGREDVVGVAALERQRLVVHPLALAHEVDLDAHARAVAAVVAEVEALALPCLA